MRMNSEKKILVIAATPFFLNKGSSVRLRSNLIALSKNNKVDLITYPVGEKIIIKNLRIVRVKVPFFNKKSAGPSFSKLCFDLVLLFYCLFYLIKNRNKYFLISGEDCEGGLIGFVLSKLFGIKFMWEMYNPWHETIKPYTKNNFIKFLFSKINSFIEKESKNITVEWDIDEKRIKNLYPNKNVQVVYDAFPTSYKKLKNINAENFILYAGSFRHYQGIEFFLDSFNSYLKKGNYIKLVLVGPFTEQIQRYVKKLSLDNLVIFTGSLDLKETNYLIKKCLFCILPRIIDGPPGIKALHYFSQGKSILGTNLSCNSRLIKNNKNGLLVEPKIYEMSKGIKKLVEEKMFLKSLESFIKVQKIGIQEKTNEQMRIFLDKLK